MVRGSSAYVTARARGPSRIERQRLSEDAIREGPAERHQRRLLEERVRKIAIDAINRRSSAETYQSRDVRLIDNAGGADWVPEAHHCHANVKLWVHHSPSHKRIRGFVLFGPMLGVWRVMAHSLVELEDGTLVDITPHGASQPYPFVRHIGTDDEFEEFANMGEINVTENRLKT
jgi:hypothetical protein